MSTVKDFITWSYPGHQQAYMAEFFAFFAKLPTDESRVVALREYLIAIQRQPQKVLGYKKFLECYFLPACKFQIPNGLPDKMPELHDLPEKVPGSIFKAMTNCGYFVEGGYPPMIPNPLKREKVFLSYFESMFKGDAHLFCAMKDQDISFVPGLSQSVVSQAYPGWIPTTSPEAIASPENTVKRALKEAKNTNMSQDLTAKPKGKPGPKRKNLPGSASGALSS